MGSKQDTGVELELRFHLLNEPYRRVLRRLGGQRRKENSKLTCAMQHGVHILWGGEDLKKIPCGARCFSQSRSLFALHMKSSRASQR